MFGIPAKIRIGYETFLLAADQGEIDIEQSGDSRISVHRDAKASIYPENTFNVGRIASRNPDSLG